MTNPCVETGSAKCAFLKSYKLPNYTARNNLEVRLMFEFEKLCKRVALVAADQGKNPDELMTQFILEALTDFIAEEKRKEVEEHA